MAGEEFSKPFFGPKDPDLDSSERKFGKSHFGEPQKDITEGRDFIEQKRLAEALERAKPSFLTDGAGIRGRGEFGSIRRTTDFGQGAITREPRQPPFPPDVTAFVTTQVSSFLPNISFLLKNATVTESGETSNKVLVLDGKINGTFPTGMGFGNYILDLDDPSDSLIYAGITFNPSTLAENSWFLGVSGSGDFPESRVESATEGFLYWLIGFTYFDDDGKFVIWQTRLGDINFAFTYGVYNAKPGLLPVTSDPGWLDLEALETPP